MVCARTLVTAEPEVKWAESALPRSLGDWHSERWERGPHALQSCHFGGAEVAAFPAAPPGTTGLAVRLPGCWSC